MLVGRVQDLPLVEWRPGVRTRLHAAGSTGTNSLCVMEQLCTPGAGAPPHRHEGVEEVIIVLEGLARIHVGGEETDLGAGERVILPAGSRHGFTNVGTDNLRILAVFAAATPTVEYEDDPGVLEIGGHGPRRRDAHRAETRKRGVVTELLYLSRAEVAGLLPPPLEQLDLVEQTYRTMASGGVELPPKPGIHPRPNAFIHAMPAYLRDEDVVVLKWIAGYRANKARGLPYLNGLIILNDPETGMPSVVMDAAEITATRTAAASGVCIRRWAPSAWRTAAILGCGVQGQRHAAVLALLNAHAVIQAFDPHPERTANLDGAVTACANAREAVRGAEIVITTAPMPEERSPEIDAEWLGDRHLLLPVDFDASVRAASIAGSDLFLVDDVGQFEYYRERGSFDGWPRANCSVGEALASGATGERVACANLGVGALDAVFAKHVLDAARKRGVGTRLPR